MSKQGDLREKRDYEEQQRALEKEQMAHLTKQVKVTT